MPSYHNQIVKDQNQVFTWTTANYYVCCEVPNLSDHCFCRQPALAIFLTDFRLTLAFVGQSRSTRDFEKVTVSAGEPARLQPGSNETKNKFFCQSRRHQAIQSTYSPQTNTV